MRKMFNFNLQIDDDSPSPRKVAERIGMSLGTMHRAFRRKLNSPEIAVGRGGLSSWNKMKILSCLILQFQHTHCRTESVKEAERR